MSMPLMWLLLVSIAIDQVPGDDILRLFDQHYYDVRYNHDRQKSYIYHLFRPQGIGTRNKYPLIVWLHGYGDIEFEEIGSGHLKHTEAIFSSADAAKKFDFYFLAVQCPPDQPGFFRSGAMENGPQPGDVTASLVKKLIAEEPIDPDRVTLIGISGAGADCLEMGMRYPDLFAGMVLLGSPLGNLTRIANLKGVPVWAFHGSEDDKIPSTGIERTVTALQNIGSKAEPTLIESNYHNCWAVAFRDYALLDWLLSQKRGSYLSRSPGIVYWTWQQWLLQAALPLLVFVAIWREVRRRWKQGESATESGAKRELVVGLPSARETMMPAAVLKCGKGV